MSIVRKEKITRPRILFLDFDPRVVKAVAEKGYVTIQGDSGFSGKPTKIDHHPSEVEIIFWDCTKLEELHRGQYSNPVWERVQKLLPFFSYVRQKGGISTVILSKDDAHSEYISASVNYQFEAIERVTTNILPPDFDEVTVEKLKYLKPLFDRFILDENIKHSIHWKDNQVGYYTFYSDEDDRKYVGFDDGGFLIFPFVSHQEDFVITALQDSFPYMTGEEIFPDMHNIVWLNSDDFTYPGVKDLENEISSIRQKSQEQVDAVEKKIRTLNEKTFYLNQALISDDSDAFRDDMKLKPQVVKMFSSLGFKVTDLDEENKKLGQALKEDIQVSDDDFFALVEVKGTERGAKASWIRNDLNAHITEYTRIRKIGASTLSSMLVFNHERRIHPTERSKPFAADPNLITYCTESNITLIPIYELYKLCTAVMIGKISAEEAKEALKNPGLYSYDEK